MSPSKMRKTRAYEAGRLAYPDGENPYRNDPPYRDRRECWDLGFSDIQSENLTMSPVRTDDRETVTIIRNLLAYAVYDRSTNDQCIDAIDAAEAFLAEVDQ